MWQETGPDLSINPSQKLINEAQVHNLTTYLMDQSKSVAVTTVSIGERQQAAHREYPHLSEHPRISVRRGDRMITCDDRVVIMPDAITGGLKNMKKTKNI